MAVKWAAGFSSAAGSCGIKARGELDLGILVAERPSAWAGSFTRNAGAAPPVQWCRGLSGRSVRAVVVNSGNANACTGAEGVRAVDGTATAAARAIGCSSQEILVASTGPIGMSLDTSPIVAALPALADDLGPDAGPFARALWTTDTRLKTATAAAGDAVVAGVAKGAAMLAPNMATMLAFLTTDAEAVEGSLERCLGAAVRVSFNRICVDACESTNDSVFLLSSGRVAGVSEEELAAAVRRVCASLAEQMVRDAEGGTKFVRIKVTGAADEEEAAMFGRVVAGSALWRSALHGSDPNWGRVLAALGSADRDLDLHDAEIAIGGEVVFARGEPRGSRELAAKHMSGDEVELSCRVGTGSGAAEILTCDLSPDYVRLNAWGTT